MILFVNDNSGILFIKRILAGGYQYYRSIINYIHVKSNLFKYSSYIRYKLDTLRNLDIVYKLRKTFSFISNSVLFVDFINKKLFIYKLIKNKTFYIDQFKKYGTYIRKKFEINIISTFTKKSSIYKRFSYQFLSITDTIRKQTSFLRKIINSIQLNLTINRKINFIRKKYENIIELSKFILIGSYIRTVSITYTISDTIKKYFSYIRSIYDINQIFEYIKRSVFISRILKLKNYILLSFSKPTDTVYRYIKISRILKQKINVKEIFFKRTRQFIRIVNNTVRSITNIPYTGSKIIKILITNSVQIFSNFKKLKPKYLKYFISDIVQSKIKLQFYFVPTIIRKIINSVLSKDKKK